MKRLRRRRVIPPDFMTRFLDRLRDGKLDSGKALDICELNSSPAARVALAAVRRWGRPAADLERAVAIAARVEADRLRRNVGTLRRIAALTANIPGERITSGGKRFGFLVTTASRVNPSLACSARAARIFPPRYEGPTPLPV